MRMLRSKSPSGSLGTSAETKNPADLRINPGHLMPGVTVFAASIHPLKNQQQGITVGRMVKVLQRAQLRDVFLV